MSSVALMSKHLDKMVRFFLFRHVCCLSGGHQVICVCTYMYGNNFAARVGPEGAEKPSTFQNTSCVRFIQQQWLTKLLLLSYGSHSQ